jgi:hypothetical protein
MKHAEQLNQDVGSSQAQESVSSKELTGGLFDGFMASKSNIFSMNNVNPFWGRVLCLLH